MTLGLSLQACYLMEVKDKADTFKWVLQVMARSKRAFMEESMTAGAPSIMAFIYYYVFGRDAVACHLPEETRLAVAALLSAEATSDEERDILTFWQLISRVETGVDEALSLLVKQFNPEDTNLLFGIWLSLRFIESLRVSSRDQKELAGKVSARLQDRVSGVMNEFSKEFKTVLLELRRGEVRELPPAEGDDGVE